jgi:hypothetical protein
MERLRREELKILLREGKIHTEPKFQPSNWPTDPLISLIKPTVASEVDSFSKTASSRFDAQDLKYQVLFRLTTYYPQDVFSNGSLLGEYLNSRGAYSDWRAISKLSKTFLEQFKLNDEVLSKTIIEQFEIIQNRLSKSDLPLDKILSPTLVSAEQNWHIHRREGKLFAAQGRHIYDRSSIVNLEIHEVDIQFANAIFRDLHYIHTPRAKVAIGLFKSGDEIPLSVIGLAPVDRNYKKDALLMQGYDPEKGWESVRLYSRPGAPMHTSSTMLSQAIKYIKANYPDTEACLSAFMPSFANGRSMIAGGFDNPVLAKTLTLTFGDAYISDTPKFERMTNRRLESYVGPIINNKVQVLPTLELLRSIKKPKETALVDQRDMIVMSAKANLEAM